ncbi:iron-containing alcohol dehydrogenase [Reyranella sp. CPCC 100927]|uniref:iron-containing alcohol dehydrogenase n=1 Tax=Reyranella sp. CPCC 100927 TaxID=2599616 RepID=UPI0011B4BB23|nr:iron-containing alcohol dehydrogenase [Reyranella sp. CPCC 100927]TWT11558.1 iron-containing alcohol dehydrogenase [Reyranella sp. CPCC 100927]
MVWRSTFTDGQYDGDIARIDLPAVDADRLADAWRCIEPSCRPAGADRAAQRRIVEEWARTVAVTAGRAGQGVDDELAIDTVVEALVRYPADCVLRALKNRRAAHKWRPTLSEILADVQWRARYREALRDAFVRAGVAAARREDDVDV